MPRGYGAALGSYLSDPLPAAGLVDLRDGDNRRLLREGTNPDAWPAARGGQRGRGRPGAVHRGVLGPAVLGDIAQVTNRFTTATGDAVTFPAACSVFPKEVPRPSRRQAERRFTNIVYWNQPARGGHFAAWEQHGLFTAEVRAAARNCAHSLR